MSCCKVGNLIEEYNVESVSPDADTNDYLIQRWVGRGEYTPTGLRPLTEWLNKQALKSVYTNHNRETFDARIESEYEAITGEEVDIAIVEDLSADGIDPEDLRSDFISTATLFRHLTNCLGVNKSVDSEKPTTEWEQNKLEYAKTVVRQSVQEGLRSLDNKDKLPGGSQATITTEVVLGCPDCNTRVGFERALARGYICQDHMGKPEAVNDE
jgi:hypothetical protein